MIAPQWFEIVPQEKHDIFEFPVYYNTHKRSMIVCAQKGMIDMLLYRFMPMRMMGGRFFGLILAVLLVVAIVLLIVVLASRKNKTPGAGAQHAALPQDRFLTLLSEQKAASGMGAAEFEERKLILEGGRADNHANADIVSLKERYARAELTTSAYIEARNKLLGIE
jgi:uncharacterized membrane protein